MPRADRDLEHLLRPSTGGVGLQVAAVEPDAAQLVWSHLPEGRVAVRIDGREVAVDHSGGPGAVAIGDLAPSTTYTATLVDRRGAEIGRRTLRTSPRPAGPELFRFATISDLHLGRDEIRAPRPGSAAAPDAAAGAAELRGQPAAVRIEALAPERDQAYRCARAAIDEALVWGAQLIVVKGDVCEESTDAAWDLAAALLGRLPVPVIVLPGNHDTGTLREFEPEHGGAARGLEVVRGVAHHDVPGLRIVAVDSTVSSSGWGRVAHHAPQVADLAAEADGAVFIATHHQPQRFSVPLYWPHGIPGPDARRFARTVRAANPSVLASSGHTHRNRRRRVAGMHWSEVAATNHFPGAWAGYTVHDGGLHQSVRRIAEPDTLEWTERSRRMLRGVWALWSAGELRDRCFTLDW